MANINALSPLWIPQANFNEALYLQRFPDVALLVKTTLISSGWAHYVANVETDPSRNIPGLNMSLTTVAPIASVAPTDMSAPVSSPLPVPAKPCCGSCAQGLPCEGEKHPFERYEWVLWVAVGILLIVAFMTPKKPA